MALDNTAKLSDIITAMQGLTGLDQKSNLVSVIGSPATATDDMATIISRLQTLKNTGATNLTAKGQTATGTETLQSLIDKIGTMTLGKKFATGTLGQTATNQTISGLTFTPTLILLAYATTNNSTPAYMELHLCGESMNSMNYLSNWLNIGNGAVSVLTKPTSGTFLITVNQTIYYPRWTAIE